MTTSQKSGGPETPSVVVRDFTSFYTLGPAQPGGPDASLRNGDTVMLIRKEWGYSFVRLEDNRTGYISNDSIAPAPPTPKPSSSDGAGSGSKKRKNGAPYHGEQVNDTPLPDLPPPNLNISPEDTPETTPNPSSTPVKPGFRY